MIAIFLVVGLIGITWAFDVARSTFKAGAGSWAGFRENWRLLGCDLGTVDTIGEIKIVRLPMWARVLGSFRAIPPSHFEAQKVGVEKSQGPQAGIQNEANAS